MYETDNQISEDQINLTENKFDNNEKKKKNTVHNNLFTSNNVQEKKNKNENNINSNAENNKSPTIITTQKNDENEKKNNENNKNNENIKDELIENELTTQNIIDNVLQSQISKINVKVLKFNEDMGEKIFGKNEIIHKIDLIEYTLLNEGDSISEFKQFGFGIYVFFLYLINLLITFGLLLIFGFYYMYCIFFKYYKDVEEDFSAFFDYDILSLVSGSQIIKFRKYYILNFGEEEFLKNYKDYDVFYKEYLLSGTLVFILIFVINFIYILYLQRVYKRYQIENPEVQNYSLIISGEDVPYINDENNNEILVKHELLKYILEVEKAKINFTYNRFDYYQQLDDLIEVNAKLNELENRKKNEECCTFCCTCSCCFECCCKKKIVDKIYHLRDRIIILKEKIEKEKKKEEYNPLHIVTFETKEDYDRVYNKYPHSYLKNVFKNMCKKSIHIYANKAPKPEDILWRNLNFDKEYKFFVNKLIIFLWSFLFLAISFATQIIQELLDKLLDDPIDSMILNIFISYWLDEFNDWFSEKINDLIIEKLNLWSLSDTKFYKVIFNSIFKLLNQGIFPFVTYLIFKEGDDNYDGLVSKMFVLIEMNGFGYPLIDVIVTLFKKGEDMFEADQKLMSEENIKKNFDQNVNNKEGLSKSELKESLKKPEMELDDDYSDALFIYWVTMFYFPIYPLAIVQSFLNLLFKYIIEKSFLLRVYQRPEFTNPQIGFFCFNIFNFGFFLLLCGNLIFFRNEYNKKSFGWIYILIMILALIVPFNLLAKLISYLTNYCCLKEKEKKNVVDVSEKFKTDYRIFNPCSQKEKIEEVFEEFKDRNLITQEEFDEFKEKLNDLNDLDFYEMQKKWRAPKKMTFEEKLMDSEFLYKNEYKKIPEKSSKEKLYYFLIQLGFMNYLEEGNILKPEKKKIEFFDEDSIDYKDLKNLSIQENLCNSDSGYFIIYYEKNKLIMAYVVNNLHVKIFDVFKKKVINDVNFLHHKEKIVCVDFFKIENERYLITISLDNEMKITNLSLNNLNYEIKTISNIGDNYNYKKLSENHFSISTIRHDRNIWIITSYNFDPHFKIFERIIEDKHNINCIHKVSFNENINSLQSLFFTEENTYICVRTSKSIGLFINQFLIRRFDTNQNEDKYINFKLCKQTNLLVYLFISTIDQNLGYYTIDVFLISNIFPVYTDLFTNFMSKITFGQNINKDIYVPMNEEIKNKIKDIEPFHFSFTIGLINKENKATIIEKLKSNEIEKYNIGNFLIWKENYIIIGTPFDYLDILDYSNRKKVGQINNETSETNINIKESGDEQNLPIISYNISELILDDPNYGSSFIMRDNKGKIQYIRASIIEDKLNYKILNSNELSVDEKLKHIEFSMSFYFFYCVISYFIPLIGGIVGVEEYDSEKELSNKYYYNSIYFYAFYIFFGIWFKGCVYNIDDETHTKRTCTKVVLAVCLGLKTIGNTMVAYRFCLGNKNGLILVFMLFIIFMTHALTNWCIFKRKKLKYLLKRYWLNYLFYQISRGIILFYFMVCILAGVDKFEIYIYALVLSVVLVYQHLVNYFNTLFKELVYSNRFQAVFNYPFEWMNIFCCFCENPKECIKEIDRRYCTCDSWFLKAAYYILYSILIIIYYICIFIMLIYGAIFCAAAEHASENH